MKIVSEKEYYLNNTINLYHCCDIMFLFLRHIDEHHRLTKMFEAIKDSLVEWNRPVQNVLQVCIGGIKLDRIKLSKGTKTIPYSASKIRPCDPL